MMIRGVRGATTVKEDSVEEVRRATQNLIQQMLKINKIEVSDLGSIVFSATHDIRSEFPAAMVRGLGLEDVPLLDVQEMFKEGALEKCIRVLMHWNTDKSQTSIKHVYLEGAKVLRPDLSN